MTEDPLTALKRIQTESARALKGMEDGSIPRGVTALTNCWHLSSDALAEAEEFAASADAVAMP